MPEDYIEVRQTEHCSGQRLKRDITKQDACYIHVCVLRECAVQNTPSAARSVQGAQSGFCAVFLVLQG